MSVEGGQPKNTQISVTKQQNTLNSKLELELELENCVRTHFSNL